MPLPSRGGVSPSCFSRLTRLGHITEPCLTNCLTTDTDCGGFGWTTTDATGS
jgi:hypothetical protein